MKRLMMLGAMIAVFGLGTAAALAGTGDQPPSPPGQPDCEHGNSQKPCKDDPQPDHGNECDEHGNMGGQNEDHCKNETTPTDTTPTDTTTDTDTTPTDTTPSETLPTETTATETTATQTSATQTTATETPSSPQAEAHVFTPPAQQPAQSKPVSQELAQSQPASVSGAGVVATPSKAAQAAPFTP
jgi:hypothetical protein